MGGPPPVGTTKARLDPFTKDVILQFAFQEVGHLRAIKNTVKGFPRPLLNLSAEAFGNVMNSAFGRALKPAFDPYANELNFLLASYVVPYVGLTGYVGANPKLQSPISKRLVAGLLAVESGQDAVIRGLLYERAREKVQPYGITVAKFTNRISKLRNKLGNAGVKDEGLIAPAFQGAEGKLKGNVLAGDQNSVGYDRTPEEILRIIYSSGDEHVPELQKEEAMAGHDDSVSSEKKSSEAVNDIPTFNAENMQNNMKAVYYSRTFMSIMGGVIAGILGFTGLNGFIFYFLVMAITSVGLIAKAGFSIHSYFDSWNQIILDGFLVALMSFVLFWTFAYDIVHIF
ncbi:hypothetical protein LOK49_LG06G03433 [Camellia lanceoleosa]|uniref:Uncharacterized protein n=1 Tax=Camellia lanceoleosa TaxID=1840588 RepID=A0ACC0HFT2_9ERIC|nr:hypothetical protein LOK49_LG06G03433 [Camellia lanceoleosa]